MSLVKEKSWLLMFRTGWGQRIINIQYKQRKVHSAVKFLFRKEKGKIKEEKVFIRKK